MQFSCDSFNSASYEKDQPLFFEVDTKKLEKITLVEQEPLKCKNCNAHVFYEEVECPFCHTKYEEGYRVEGNVFKYVVDKKEKKDEITDLYVFCIDISGSMNREKRLAIAKESALKQIDEIYKKDQNSGVYLISFGTQCTLYGDCENSPVILNEDISKEDLKRTIEEMNVNVRPLHESRIRIGEAIKKLERCGLTNTGCALYSSCFIAQKLGKSASVTVYTDGNPIETMVLNKNFNEVKEEMEKSHCTLDVKCFRGCESYINCLKEIIRSSNGKYEVINPTTPSSDLIFVPTTIIGTDCDINLKLEEDLFVLKEDSVMKLDNIVGNNKIYVYFNIKKVDLQERREKHFFILTLQYLDNEGSRVEVVFRYILKDCDEVTRSNCGQVFRSILTKAGDYYSNKKNYQKALDELNSFSNYKFGEDISQEDRNQMELVITSLKEACQKAIKGDKEVINDDPFLKTLNSGKDILLGENK